MNPKREIRMLRLASVAVALSAAAFVAGGCDMNVQNPNAPDAARAFKDPAGLAQLLGGAFRTWVDTRGSYYMMPLNAMADNYSASWNNAAMRLYSSIGSDCASRCGWNNSSAATETGGGRATEVSWYGYYTVLSGANDVLKAIASGTCFDTDCGADNTLTQRDKTIGQMLQGMAFAGLAVLYDSAFVVDESVDLTKTPPTTLSLSHRQVVRDSALSKFEQAYAAAGVKSWSTEAAWMGVGAGKAYTNAQIRQVIRTMEAELIAMYPRNGAENTAAADWAKVATYASQGISSGTSFNWEFYIDVGSRECGLDCMKVWGNSIGTERVNTRVAHMLSVNHVDPWPVPNGNPCLFSVSIWGSVDKRAGDGSWGPTDDFNGYGTTAATANAGTDFDCTTVAIFPPARGQYHQSNMHHHRYSYLAYRGEDLETEDGTGQDPMYTTQMNDLLWAEGLIRSGGSLAQAATLINNSRVGRGGLPPAAAGDGVAGLLAKLYYEQEIEFMGQGTDPFYIKRRTGTPARAYCTSTVDGLCAGTPRQMPVPAKELLVLVREIYTYGGPSLPDMSIVGSGNGSPTSGQTSRVRSVREIYQQYSAMARAEAGRRF